jgi:cobalamin biosynthesis protein CobT
MGGPDDIEQVISLFGDHDEKPKSVTADEEAHAIDKAVIQGIYFNKPSQRVFGVREHYINKHAIVNGVDYSVGWYEVDPARAKRSGKSYDDELDETILQPVLGEVRRAFTDNQRGKRDPNRKSGKINPAALGKRAWNDDPRLFMKNTRPGKKSYAVILHMDLSGSTVGKNLALEKRAVLLQAEVLNRAGIPFAIVGHTGNYLDASDRNATTNELVLEIYHIKDFDQTWEEAKYALKTISGHGVNLDGHALEYLRKLADSHRATDKIIMYYSDGKMPSSNHDEELEILQDEIKTCRDRNHTLLGVGIRTDSPTRHGLSTVQVDQGSDLGKVVQHLGRRLSETR